MEMISHLENYNATRAKKALQMLLIDRSNEFRELAHGIGYPTTEKNWEEIVLRFSLDFVECFKTWSGKNTDYDHNEIHRCMLIMRQLARGKSNVNALSDLQNTAYLISEDFKAIYKRIE
ncbi:MAG: hypothetical protein ACREAF_00595 [Nitrosopumilaceae archaeon]